MSSFPLYPQLMQDIEDTHLVSAYAVLNWVTHNVRKTKPLADTPANLRH